MNASDPKLLRKIQESAHALIERRIATSLVDVESALAYWRAGEGGVLAVHAEILRHADRCDRTINLVTAHARTGPESILRDCVDAGLMSADDFTKLVGKAPCEVEPIGALEDRSDADQTIDVERASDKRQVVESLLQQGPLLVHIDARHDDVCVPPKLRGNASLVLRLGHGLKPPIYDLVVDDDGISATLTFGASPSHCKLPWNRIYATVLVGAAQGMVWPQDIPPDAAIVAHAAQATPIDKADSRPRASHLKLVD